MVTPTAFIAIPWTAGAPALDTSKGQIIEPGSYLENDHKTCSQNKKAFQSYKPRVRELLPLMSFFFPTQSMKITQAMIHCCCKILRQILELHVTISTLAQEQKDGHI